MIVFSTHKNPATIDKCLASLMNFKTEDHKIIVYETSDSQESKEIVEKYGCIFDNSGPHYEPGSICRAFQNFDEEEYFFFQDSIEFMCFEWEKIFRKPSAGERCIGLSTFPLNLDHNDTIHGMNWFEEVTGRTYDKTTRPIFANMFYCPRKIKDMLLLNGCMNFICNEKIDSCGMERIWPALLTKELVGFTEEVTGDFWNWQHYIKKTWMGRS